MCARGGIRRVLTYVFPNLSPLCCDKLSATLPVPMTEENSIVAKIEEMHQVGHATFGRKGNYKFGRNFDVSANDLTSAFLNIQFVPKNKASAFMRFEFNPAKCSLHRVREYLDAILPGGYAYFVGNAFCTRVDATRDVLGSDINDLIYWHPGIQVTRTFCRSGRLETYYLGSPVSPRRFCFYDKRAEVERKNAKSPIKTPLPPQHVTRFEARVKDIPLFTLPSLSNPFVDLEVSYRHKHSNDDDEFFRMFLEATRFQGGQKLLAQLSEKTAKDFKARLRTGRPVWWKPSHFWNGWPKIAKTILKPPVEPFTLKVPENCAG